MKHIQWSRENIFIFLKGEHLTQRFHGAYAAEL